MKVLLSAPLQSVTPRELEQHLAQLPEWRRRYALSYHFHIDRVLCCEAYLLLKRGLEEEYGLNGNPEFGYGDRGKPFLKGHPGIHFSLSHCRCGVLCAIDDKPVGCDIEAVPDRIDEALCRLCLSENEMAAVAASDAPRVRFTEFWTRKEAVLKMTGEGISDNLPSLFEKEDTPGYEIETGIYPEWNFVCSICGNNLQGCL